MAAVPIALLDRPPTQAPELEEVPEIGTPPVGPNEVEFIPDTDTLITACNCSASSDNPYN